MKKKKSSKKSKDTIIKKFLIIFLTLFLISITSILIIRNNPKKSFEIAESIYYYFTPYKINSKITLRNDSTSNFIDGTELYSKYRNVSNRGLIDLLSSKYSKLMMERYYSHPHFFRIWRDENKIIFLPDYQESFLKISIPLTKKEIRKIYKNDNYYWGKLSNSKNAIKLYESISKIFTNSGFILDEENTNTMIDITGIYNENAKHFSYVSPNGVRCNLSYPKQGRKNDLFSHIYLYCIDNETYQKIKTEQVEILNDLDWDRGINIRYNDGKYALLGTSEVLYKDRNWEIIASTQDIMSCNIVDKYQIPFSIAKVCYDENSKKILKRSY